MPASRVTARPEHALPPPSRRLLLFVHGFNVDLGEARDAYACLRRDQRARAGDLFSVSKFEQGQWDLFWPGDADWAWLDFLDPLVFPKAVEVAQQIAPRLAAFLDDLKGVDTIDFFAHSLGCRLVLETIGHLKVKRPGRLCLAAAAVPSFMVQRGGRLLPAAVRAEHVRVLHSFDDEVLALAFPPGQSLARGAEGVFPVALGRNGEMDASIPGVARPMPHANHGDYWGHDPRPGTEEGRTERLARKRCGAEFSAFLGLTDTGVRSLPERPQPPGRELAWRRPLRSRR